MEGHEPGSHKKKRKTELTCCLTIVYQPTKGSSTIAAELPTRHNNNGDCLVQYCSIFTERNMNYLPLPEPPAVLLLWPIQL
jgi:hypothetical protein